MIPANHNQSLNLSGRTDRVQQLAHVSLVDGSDNTLVGLNSGTKLAQRDKQNTVVGAEAATLLAGASNNAIVGARAAERASALQDSVVVGAGAGAAMSNVTTTVVVGVDAGARMDKSSFNTAVGYAAAGSMTSGARNVAVGSYAGYYTRNASDNVFVGDSSGRNVRYGSQNTFVGSLAGLKNSFGNTNVFVGARAGSNNVYGDRNVFLGALAGENNFLGSNNIFVGVGSGRFNSVGNNLTFIGGYAGQNNQYGSNNTFLGQGAGSQNSNGSQNVFVGTAAGQSNQRGNGLVYVGAQAGRQTSNAANTVALGTLAAAQVDDAHDSVFVGHSAGLNADGATAVVALGAGAGSAAANAANSVFVGTAAGATATGTDNTLVGHGVGPGGSGNQNTIVGSRAAANADLEGSVVVGYGAATNLVGSNNVVVGKTLLNENGSAVDSSVVVGVGLANLVGNNVVVVATDSVENTRLSNAVIVGHTIRGNSELELANTVALGMNYALTNADSDTFVVGFNDRRVMQANADSLVLGDSQTNTAYFEATTNSLQLGGLNQFLVANTEAFSLNSGNVQYFYADKDTIRVSGGNTQVFFANSSELIVGNPAVIWANAQSIQLSRLDGNAYFYANGTYIRLGEPATPVLEADGQYMRLGHGTSEYMYSTATSLVLGGPTNRFLDASTDEFSVGSNADARYLFANGTVLYMKTGSGSNVVYVDPSRLSIGEGGVLVATDSQLTLGGINRYLEANSREVSLGDAFDRYFFANGSVFYMRSAGTNVLYANAGTLYVGNGAGGSAVYLDSSHVQLGSSVYAGNGTFLLGPNDAPVVFADPTKLFIGNVFYADATRLHLKSGLSNVVYADTQRLQIGPDTGPVLSADTSRIHIRGGVGPNQPTVVLANANTLQLGNGVTKALYIDPDTLQIGPDTRPVIFADATKLQIEGASSTVLYADNDTFQIGSNTQPIVFADATRLAVKTATGANVIWATSDTLQLGNGATKAVYIDPDTLQIGPDARPVIFADATKLQIEGASSTVLYADNDTFQIGSNTQPIVFADATRLAVKTAAGANVIWATSDTLQLGNGVTKALYIDPDTLQIGPDARPVIFADATKLQIEGASSTVLYADNDTFQIGSNTQPIVFADATRLSIRNGASNVIWVTANTLQIGNGATKAVYIDNDTLQIGPDARPVIFADATKLQIEGASSTVLYADNDTFQIGSNTQPIVFADATRLAVKTATGANVIWATSDTLQLGNGVTKALYIDPDTLQIGPDARPVIFADATKLQIEGASSTVLYADNDTFQIGSNTQPIVFADATRLAVKTATGANVIWATSDTLQLGNGVTKAVYIDPDTLQIGPDARPVIFADATKLQIEGASSTVLYADNDTFQIGSNTQPIVFADATRLAVKTATGANVIWANSNTLQIGDGVTKAVYIDDDTLQIGPDANRVILANATQLHVRGGGNTVMFFDNDTLQIGRDSSPIVFADATRLAVKTAAGANVLWANANTLQIGDGATKAVYIDPDTLQIGPDTRPVIFADATKLQIEGAASTVLYADNDTFQIGSNTQPIVFADASRLAVKTATGANIIWANANTLQIGDGATKAVYIDDDTLQVGPDSRPVVFADTTRLAIRSGNSNVIWATANTLQLGNGATKALYIDPDTLQIGPDARPVIFADATKLQIEGASSTVLYADNDTFQIGSNTQPIVFADATRLAVKTATGANVIWATSDTLQLGNGVTKALYIDPDTLQVGPDARPVIFADATKLQIEGASSTVLYADNDTFQIGSNTQPIVFADATRLAVKTAAGANVIWATANTLQLGNGVTKALYIDPDTLQIGPDARPVVFADATKLQIEGAVSTVLYADNDTFQIGSNTQPIVFADATRLAVKTATGANVIWATANTLQLGNGATKALYIDPDTLQIGPDARPVIFADATKLQIEGASSTVLYADNDTFQIGSNTQPIVFADSTRLAVKTAAGANVIWATANTLQLGNGATKALYIDPDTLQIGPDSRPVVFADATKLQIEGASSTVLYADNDTFQIGSNTQPIVFADATRLAVKTAAGANIIWANANTLQIGDGATKAVYIDDDTLQIGRDAAPILKANTDVFFIKQGTANVVYSSSNVLQLGDNSLKALQATRQSLQLGSDTSPYLVADSRQFMIRGPTSDSITTQLQLGNVLFNTFSGPSFLSSGGYRDGSRLCITNKPEQWLSGNPTYNIATNGGFTAVLFVKYVSRNGFLLNAGNIFLGGMGVGGPLKLSIYDDGGTWREVYPYPTSTDPEEWVVLGVRYNRTANVAQVIENDEVIGSVSVPVQLANKPAAYTVIGGYVNTIAEFADIMVWDRALTDAELTQSYEYCLNGGGQRPSSPVFEFHASNLAAYTSNIVYANATTIQIGDGSNKILKASPTGFQIGPDARPIFRANSTALHIQRYSATGVFTWGSSVYGAYTGQGSPLPQVMPNGGPGDRPYIQFAGTNNFLRGDVYYEMGTYDGFTALAYAKFDTSSGTSFERLIDLGNAATNGNMIFSRFSTGNQLCLQLYTGTTLVGNVVSSAGTIVGGQWALFACRIRNSTLQIELFKDGQVVGTGTIASALTNRTLTQNYIGARAGTAYLNGGIETMLIYPRYLTDAELDMATEWCRNGGDGDVPYSGGVEQRFNMSQVVLGTANVLHASESALQIGEGTTKAVQISNNRLQIGPDTRPVIFADATKLQIEGASSTVLYADNDTLQIGSNTQPIVFADATRLAVKTGAGANIIWANANTLQIGDGATKAVFIDDDTLQIGPDANRVILANTSQLHIRGANNTVVYANTDTLQLGSNLAPVLYVSPLSLHLRSRSVVTLTNGQSIPCYVDNITDGGGWILVLNYVHKAGTNPSLTVRTTTTGLPLLGSTTLGVDESTSTGYGGTWGHAGTALMSLLQFDEVRFYGRTSGHSRILHFKSPYFEYFKTGTGNVPLWNLGGFTALDGHTAFLPASMGAYFQNQGDSAMTEFPFYGGLYHWGIRGLGTRWEVDDYPNSAANDTIHQIWVRDTSGSVGDTVLYSDPETLQLGGNAAPVLKANNDVFFIRQGNANVVYASANVLQIGDFGLKALQATRTSLQIGTDANPLVRATPRLLSIRGPMHDVIQSPINWGNTTGVGVSAEPVALPTGGFRNGPRICITSSPDQYFVKNPSPVLNVGSNGGFTVVIFAKWITDSTILNFATTSGPKILLQKSSGSTIFTMYSPAPTSAWVDAKSTQNIGNTWTVITGWYSTVYNRIRLYLNNQMVAESTVATDIPNLPSGYGDAGMFFVAAGYGTVMEFANYAVWDRALTQQEMAQMYRYCRNGGGTKPANAVLELHAADLVVGSSNVIFANSSVLQIGDGPLKTVYATPSQLQIGPDTRPVLQANASAMSIRRWSNGSPTTWGTSSWTVTKSGSPVVIPEGGPENRSYVYFNGSTDFFSRGSTLYEVGLYGGFTAFIYARFDTVANWSRLFDFGSGADADNLLFARNGVTTQMTFVARNGSTIIGQIYSPFGSIVLGEWAVWACRFINSTLRMEIWKNGELVSSGTSTANVTNRTLTLNYIGKSNWPDALFQGGMETFLFWPRPLSDAEMDLALEYCNNGGQGELPWPNGRGSMYSMHASQLALTPSNVIYASNSVLQIGDPAVVYADSQRLQIRQATLGNVVFANANVFYVGGDATPAIYADSTQLRIRSGTSNVLYSSNNVLQVGDGNTRTVYSDLYRLAIGTPIANLSTTDYFFISNYTAVGNVNTVANIASAGIITLTLPVGGQYCFVDWFIPRLAEITSNNAFPFTVSVEYLYKEGTADGMCIQMFGRSENIFGSNVGRMNTIYNAGYRFVNNIFDGVGNEGYYGMSWEDGVTTYYLLTATPPKIPANDTWYRIELAFNGRDTWKYLIVPASSPSTIWARGTLSDPQALTRMASATTTMKTRVRIHGATGGAASRQQIRNFSFKAGGEVLYSDASRLRIGSILYADDEQFSISDLGGRNYILANTTQLAIRQASGSNVVYASNSVLQIGDGATKAVYASGSVLQIGSDSNPYIYAAQDRFHIRGSGGANVIFSNSSVLQIGDSALGTQAVYASNAQLYLGPTTNYILSANSQLLHIRQGTNTVLFANSRQLQIGADASPLFLANDTMIDVRTSGGTQYLFARSNNIVRLGVGGAVLNAETLSVRVGDSDGTEHFYGSRSQVKIGYLGNVCNATLQRLSLGDTNGNTYIDAVQGTGITFKAFGSDNNLFHDFYINSSRAMRIGWGGGLPAVGIGCDPLFMLHCSGTIMSNMAVSVRDFSTSANLGTTMASWGLDLGVNRTGRNSLAGTLRYENSATGVLDIYGAGTAVGSRGIKLWDHAEVSGNLRVASYLQVTGTNNIGFTTDTMANNKICLWGSGAAADTGEWQSTFAFGINSSCLRYQVPLGSRHGFFIRGNERVYFNDTLAYFNTAGQFTGTLSVPSITLNGSNVHSIFPQQLRTHVPPTLAYSEGTVSWSSGNLLWTNRLLLLPVNNSVGTNGYFQITCPTSGTITRHNGTITDTVTCTASGIPLAAWSALYYVYVPGAVASTNQAQFRVVVLNTTTFVPDETWVLIGVHHASVGVLRWVPNNINIPNNYAYNSTTASLTYSGGTTAESLLALVPSTDNNKLCLWATDVATRFNPAATDVYGLGVNNSMLRFNVAGGAVFGFYGNNVLFGNIGYTNSYLNSDLGLGVAPSSGAKLTVSGNVRIAEGYVLSYASGLVVQNNMICLYANPANQYVGTSTNVYGLGMEADAIRYNALSGKHHRFYANTTLIANLNSTSASLTSTALEFTGDTRITGNARLASGYVLGFAAGFATQQNNMICFSGASQFSPTQTNMYGLGIENNDALRYAAKTGKGHRFYADTTLLANIGPDGLVITGSTGQKLTGTTWTNPSDSRIKANIELANLDICTQVVRNVPLKRFEWAFPQGSNVAHIADKKVVGWIAQDVEQYLPNAVTIQESFGIADALVLDSDQLIKMMYGALQQAWNEIDSLKARVSALEG